MEQTHESFAKELEGAIRRGDEEKFRHLMVYFPPSWGDDPSLYEGFPEPVFETILNVLSDGSLCPLANSSQLFITLEGEWDNLSAVQKDALLPVLGRSYGTFQDWLADFTISELLGEYYCDDRALLLLLDLKERIQGRARALVPHGFEHIVRGASSEDLRRRALDELQRMKGDADEEVRDEAETSLERVRRSMAE